MIYSEIEVVLLEETVHWGLGFAFILNDFLRRGSCLHIQIRKYNINTKVQENIQMLVTVCCLI